MTGNVGRVVTPIVVMVVVCVVIVIVHNGIVIVTVVMTVVVRVSIVCVRVSIVIVPGMMQSSSGATAAEINAGRAHRQIGMCGVCHLQGYYVTVGKKITDRRRFAAVVAEW